MYGRMEGIVGNDHVLFLVIQMAVLVRHFRGLRDYTGVVCNERSADTAVEMDFMMLQFCMPNAEQKQHR